MHRIRGRLTYSNVMVTVLAALVIGGGTAYAAAEMLPAGSVGTKQIQKGAVTPSKLNKASRRALTGPTGAPGSTGPRGAKGDTGERGATGEKGDRGEIGPAGPLAEVLPSGKTERGFYVFNGTSGGSGNYTPNTSISFSVPLAAAPVANFISKGESPTATCPGTVAAPAAAPGNLCIYEARDAGSFETGAESETESARFGALLYVSPTPNSNYEIEGTYAVTAP